MIEVHRPLVRRAFFTSSADKALTSFFPKSMLSCLPSVLICTSSNLRFSPLTTALTVPLTGEVKRMSGRFLSAMMGVPQSTLSPSFTKSLGIRPLNSQGLRATTSPMTVFSHCSAATPQIGSSRPFFSLMLFDIMICFYSCFVLL